MAVFCHKVRVRHLNSALLAWLPFMLHAALFFLIWNNAHAGWLMQFYIMSAIS